MLAFRQPVNQETKKRLVGVFKMNRNLVRDWREAIPRSDAFRMSAPMNAISSAPAATAFCAARFACSRIGSVDFFANAPVAGVRRAPEDKGNRPAPNQGIPIRQYLLHGSRASRRALPPFAKSVSWRSRRPSDPCAIASSHDCVLTGGNSSRRLSVAIFLHLLSGSSNNFDQKPKWIFGSRFGVNEEDRGSSRSFPWSLVDDLKSACLHGIESPLRTLNAESHVRQPAAPAVSLDQLLHRRVQSQRLEQLNQVGAVAHLQQRFAHLVVA